MDEPSFYGFPTYGEAGPKAAEDVGGDESRPGDADVRARRGRRSPALTRLPARPPARRARAGIYTKTCLYTLTPDRDFVLDRVPEAPGVVVALGAAHAFKFASVFGRILAELIVDGATPSAGEIERLPDRPADPARSTTRRRA